MIKLTKLYSVRCSFCGALAYGSRDAVSVCNRRKCTKLFNRAVDRELDAYVAAFDAARLAWQNPENVKQEDFRCEDYV